MLCLRRRATSLFAETENEDSDYPMHFVATYVILELERVV
jgi:hypothetical protein